MPAPFRPRTDFRSWLVSTRSSRCSDTSEAEGQADTFRAYYENTYTSCGALLSTSQSTKRHSMNRYQPYRKGGRSQPRSCRRGSR